MTAPFFRAHFGRPGVAEIQTIVAAAFGSNRAEMLGPRQCRAASIPRHVAMLLVKEITPLSIPDIGRRFGGRDHTTVLSALRSIERRAAADADVAAQIMRLRRRLQPPAPLRPADLPTEVQLDFLAGPLFDFAAARQ